MKTFKRLLSVVTALAMVMGLCSVTVLADTAGGGSDEVVIVLSDGGITVDGEAVSTSEDDAVYIANDIIYYEDLDYYEDTGYEYGEGTDADKHSEEEAAAHTVVHITEAGTYRISGTLSCGQIFIDLGDDAKEDETAVVTLILDGVDITCTVAPAVLFYSVYECDTAWVAYDEGDADSYDASAVQDTSAAGANVIIADGSENNINGSYVAKIYKNNGNSKKLYKFDGAFYSKMSMNIDGEDEDTGILNIYAEYEGLDSELHLTINGGTINIQSQDDGINTNEDNVSVTTINGGSVHILAGLGDEGDGIDSNGYLMINGGVVISIANPSADSGLDSDCGSYINGGTVLATGSTMDWSDEDAENGLGIQPTMNLQFEEAQDSDEAIIVTDSDGNVIFAYDPDQDETTGSYNRGYQGAIISCSELEVGATYYVYVGGTVYGTDTNGLYDNSTVTGFTGAVRQIYTGTDVGMDNMPGTGNNSGMGDMGDSDSTFPGGDSGMGDMGDSDSTFPGGDLDSGDSGMGDMGDMGGDSSGGSSQIQPRSTLYDTAAGAVEEGTTYSNQFYLTDYVNEFSGVQDDPDYVSDDTDSDDGTTDDDSTDDDSSDGDSTYPDIDGDMAVPPDDGSNDDDSTDDDSTDDDSSDGDSTYPDIDGDMAVPPDDGTTDDDSTDDDSSDDDSTDDGTTDDGSSDDDSTDDGSADDDSSDDTSSDSTTSGNWDAYLEYLIAYAEENYDSIAAPDSDSTVEELTAAIADLTEDTYSSSILYSVLTELGGASTYEEWLAENGTADDDTSDDDAADDDTSDVPGDSLDVIPSPDLDDDDTDDGTTDDDTSDDSTSGETASGNWDAYLEYLIAYAEENYDSIAAPDSDTTVEELTAAIAELTEDTYSSSILYSVLTELGGASTYEEWLAENGTDDDTTDDDTTDDGSSDVPDDSLDVIPSPDLDDDTADDGSSDDGTTDDGSSDNGTTDDGSADNDSTDDGSADSGSTDNGSADNGSTDDGSADNNSADTDNESTDDAGSSDTGSGSSDEDTDDGGNTNAADSDTDAGTDSGSETENDADAEADTEGTGADDDDSDADADDTDDADADSDDDSDDDSSSSSDDTDDDSEASVGDHSNLVLWMVLAAGSIIALAWVGLKRRFN